MNSHRFKASEREAGRWDRVVRGGRARRFFPVGKPPRPPHAPPNLPGQRAGGSDPFPQTRRVEVQLQPRAQGPAYARVEGGAASRLHPLLWATPLWARGKVRLGAQAESRGPAGRPPLRDAASGRVRIRGATAAASGPMTAAPEAGVRAAAAGESRGVRAWRCGPRAGAEGPGGRQLGRAPRPRASPEAPRLSLRPSPPLDLFAP